MSSTAGPAPPARATRPRLALATTLSVQAMATLALTAPSVMAPAIAPLLDVPPQRIGWFVGLAYLAAMFSGLAGGARVARVGAIRMSRFAVLACAAGLAIGAFGASSAERLPLLALSAIALGMGYGLPNPAASRASAVGSGVRPPAGGKGGGASAWSLSATARTLVTQRSVARRSRNRIKAVSPAPHGPELWGVCVAPMNGV